MGPGFAIWVVLLGVAAALVARRAGAPSPGAVVGWSAVAAAAAVAMTLRDTEVLIPLLLLVLLTAASMVLLRVGGVRLWATKPADHVLGFAMVPARSALGVVPLLGDLRPSEESSRHRLSAAGRGVLLAAPLLLVFGALFVSADAGFSRILSEEALKHVVIVIVVGWFTAGLLSGVRAKRLPNPLAGFTTPRLGTEETAVVLGLLALLFLIFVGFQLGYLFGGRGVIEATTGLTVADYARRGFFELMVVGILTIGVLLVGDALTTSRRAFRWFAALLIACVLVMLASAAQRLMLYTDAFGLTVDRITAAAVMIWVAAVLVLFAVTVLRERPGLFSSGAVVTGIVTAFSLVIVNPGAMAARSNLERAVAGVREADVGFLAGLGGDAVPVILERIDELPLDARCELGGRLLTRWADDDTDAARKNRDWRTWNAARAAAHEAVRASGAGLAAVGCPAPESPAKQ
jgi:hypothetical protein